MMSKTKFIHMQNIVQNDDLALYQLEDRGQLKRFIVTTPETRSICNDPGVYGVEYTDKMKMAMGKCIGALPEKLEVTQEQGMVFNILRGGLNFGLREALVWGKGWKDHRTAFISAQRVYDEEEGWHITENRYEKVYLPDEADIYVGDVVATGVSLGYALKKMVSLAREQKVGFKRITFFTIGSERTEELMEEIDKQCRDEFPGYEETRVVYIEGVFGMPKDHGSLDIALQGTDLLRWPAVVAPEFLASQAEDPAYPLERCTIYDAGSRAFNAPEYLEDVQEYWGQVKELAEKGMTYSEYLKQRVPECPGNHEGDANDLMALADRQIQKCSTGETRKHQSIVVETQNEAVKV
jgi:hypothetical protein